MNADRSRTEKTGRMSPTDNELMEAVRDGRVEKLAVLFERYQTMLYNFFLRLTGNRAASEDLVQEVFVRVLKYRAGYLGDSRFNVWLFQIARNAHIDHLRKQKPALSLDEQFTEMPSREPQPDAAYETDREAELVRREIGPGGDLVKTETIVVSPERAVSGDRSGDIPLKEYDLLVVRRIPDWAGKIEATLSGEVRFPGTYAARKGERLSSLVARAGGFTPDAYLKAAQFTRVSTQKDQQEAIDKLIEDLELEVAQKGQEVTGVLDKEDVEANKQLLEARRAIIAQLRKTRAKGRVIIRLAAAEKMAGTSADILLEDGDRLEVPRKTNVVNVVGRVYNPTGVVYDPAADRVRDYLDRVGGPTASADRDHIFLIRADGSVATGETADGGFLGGGLLGARVEPGDAIVVPEKLLRTRLMKDVKDITQILYQIAVTAGVLIVAF